MTLNLSLEQRANLVTLYSEPQRHYHTLAHVHQLLREIEALPLDDGSKEILEAAAWFHDAVYDPMARKGYNEERSAHLFSHAYVNMVGKLSAIHCILATKDHVAPEGSNKSLCQTFLDIDLSILGKPEDVYDRYAYQIGQEYIQQNVSCDQYNTGRLAFLNKMIER